MGLWYPDVNEVTLIFCSSTLSTQSYILSTSHMKNTQPFFRVDAGHGRTRDHHNIMLYVICASLGTFIFCLSAATDIIQRDERRLIALSVHTTLNMKLTQLLVSSFFCSCHVGVVAAFSTPSDSSSDAAAYALFDRFRASCPAEPSCIRAFDASLLNDNEQDSSTWVAVYRSSNNKPSVFVKDEFLNAMRIATGATESSSSLDSEKIETNTLPLQEVPVAVARLRPSNDFKGAWIMDSMRCLLKKEDTNQSCDGGSEHAEALGVGIDALLLNHLQNHDVFAIRTKATLVSGVLLEERGFCEVEKLSKDMATHVASLDACMEGYSKRTIVQGAKNPGARDRALKILNLLGRLDPSSSESSTLQQGEEDENDDFDPWAGVKQFI